MKKLSFLFIVLSLPLFTGCTDPYPPTPRPDYTIHVKETSTGLTAIPPECPSWATATTDPYDNQPVPQFGCATARNLALSVENPNDLVHGRTLGPQRGVTAVGSIRRYDADQTRGLIDPDTNPDSAVATTTSSAPASSLSGDASGGAAPATPAAAPAASGP